MENPNQIIAIIDQQDNMILDILFKNAHDAHSKQEYSTKWKRWTGSLVIKQAMEKKMKEKKKMMIRILGQWGQIEEGL